jgi:vacuolar protein sorting-associated protein 11
MCRQGGYYEQAAYLAKTHKEHELVVDILIEDSKRYDEALDYICRLEPDAVRSDRKLLSSINTDSPRRT